MPGPGAHLLYALTGGAALSRLAGPDRRFGPHHCAVYAANAFLGPDLGSFAEWLCSFLPSASAAGDLAMAAVHHPFYYPLLLGLPLAWAYAWLSRRLLRAGVLDSPSGVPLRKRQCFLLIFAGSLSHFFLDHLFEENGHSTMYTWILSTGWWKGRAPINPDAVLVVGLLCTCLMGGVCVHQQSEAWKVCCRKIKPFFLSHPDDSHPVLYVVCQSDIPAATPSTCHSKLKESIFTWTIVVNSSAALNSLSVSESLSRSQEPSQALIQLAPWKAVASCGQCITEQASN